LLVLLASAHPSSAADGPGIAAGPTFQEVDVAPGGLWEGKINVVAGQFAQPTTFDIEIKDLQQVSSGEKRIAESGTGVRSAASWIDAVDELSLASGERTEIGLRLHCPGDAVGSYSAFVEIRVRTPEAEKSPMQMTMIPSIAVELLIRVRSQGDLRVEAESLSFVADREGPFATLDLVNSGVWRAEFTGEIILYPEAGGFPLRIPIPYRSDGRLRQIYPGTRLTLQCPASPIPDGKYRALVKLDLGEGRESRRKFALKVGEAGGGPGTVLGDREEIGAELWLEKDLHELNVPPGATRTVPVKVRNLGTRPIALTAAIRTATMATDGALLVTDAAAEAPGLNVAVAPENQVLRPRGNATFRVTVSVEHGAEFTKPIIKRLQLTGVVEGDEQPAGWRTVYDTGCLLVIAPPRIEPAKLSIIDLELIRISPTRDPGSALLTVGNAGGTTGFLKGHLAMAHDAGSVMGKLNLGGERWEPILPGGKRVFRMPLPLVDAGVYTVSAELVQKDSGDPPLKASTQFTSTVEIPEGVR